MLIHVPALMSHSFLFLFLCERLVVISTENKAGPITEASLNVFVYAYCGLLLLNSIWLYMLRDRGDSERPEFFWMYNNKLCAAFSVLAFALLSYTGFPIAAFIVALAIFLVNSALDLWFCAETYMLDKQG